MVKKCIIWKAAPKQFYKRLQLFVVEVTLV